MMITIRCRKYILILNVSMRCHQRKSSCLNPKIISSSWTHTLMGAERTVDLLKWETRSMNLQDSPMLFANEKMQKKKLFIKPNQNAEFLCLESNVHRFSHFTFMSHIKYAVVNCEAWIVRSEPIHSFIIQLTCKCIRSIVMNWWASRGLELKNSETISAILRCGSFQFISRPMCVVGNIIYIEYSIPWVFYSI